jgi:ABC-type antimicrobial peptide transport system permease subunit
LVGALASIALSYSIARFVLEIPWDFSPAQTLAGITLTVMLVTIVGVGSSLNALTRKPLAILRGQ